MAAKRTYGGTCYWLDYGVERTTMVVVGDSRISFDVRDTAESRNYAVLLEPAKQQGWWKGTWRATNPIRARPGDVLSARVSGRVEGRRYDGADGAILLFGNWYEDDATMQWLLELRYL